MIFTHQVNAGGDSVPPERIYDFGTITEGQELDCEFTYTNKHESVVKALSIRTTCGCAKGKFEAQDVKPGEKIKFTVHLISKGRRGELNKNIYLVTDFHNDPVIKYVLRGKIDPAPRKVACSAETKLDAGIMLPEEKKELSLKITNQGTQDKLIIRKGAIGQAISLSENLPIEIAPGKEKMLKIIYIAPEYAGESLVNLMLETNDTLVPQLWIQIKSRIENPSGTTNKTPAKF